MPDTVSVNPTQVGFRIKKIGLIDFSKLYLESREFFDDYKYIFHETQHKSKDTDKGRKLDIKWLGYREVDKYAKFQIKVNIVANTRNSWYRAIEKLKGFLKSSLNGENTLNFFESVRSIPEFRSKSDEEIVECMENMFKKIKERKVKTTIFSNIYHKRAPYRKAIKGLDIDQILELELDEGESMGSLRFMIEKAAKEVGRQIQSGETRDGTLLIWLLPDSAKI